MQLVAQVRTSHRPYLSLFLERIADFQRFDMVRELLEESVVYRVHHNEPLCRNTGLPDVLITRPCAGLCGIIDIGIVENDVRIRPAELEHARFQFGARCCSNGATRGFRAGESYCRDYR